ncbi:hypothetical protein BGZ63DRAFT_41630 [Mariannaea sp. PMI_226]|nr:hypothetical protein BGZ63DRAFT_41630 [Mariannaea sp. PMI_226]
MDPITAIGVASGILSFVTFAASIVQGGIKIYKSGNLEDNATLEDVINKMSSFQARLVPPDVQAQTEDEKTLVEFVNKSKSLSDELLELLQKTKRGEGSGLRVMWKSLKKSWEKMLSESRKTEIETEIGNIERRTTLVLTQLTRVAVEKLVTAVGGHDGKLDQMTRNIDELMKLKDLNKAIQKDIKSLIDTQQKAVDKICSDRVLGALKYTTMTNRSQDLKNLLSTIENNESYGENDGSHRDAFGWIFNSEDEDATVSDENERELRREARGRFLNWLSSPNGGIFHIAGKPGAGKSTMMQFLFDHSKTREELEKWSGGNNKTLVMLHYSFVRKEEIQQDLDGLFRTLLYDILHERRESIVEVLASAWERALKLSTDTVATFDIPMKDKSQALSAIFSGLKFPNINWCVFIDGLDEFHNSNKDMLDLVEMLQGWAPSTGSNVKLCVASRVEPPFTVEFDPAKRFLVHELTKYDMRLYVKKRLDRVTRETREHLVVDIPNKAEGIFVWVYLVVSSIRLKVGRREKVDLDVLDQFPTELSSLLDTILASIAPMDISMVYQTIRMMEVLQESGMNLSLPAFSFLDEYNKDPSFAWNRSFTETEEFDEDRVEDARQKLYGQCKGLIEAGPDGEAIKFIHRSVREHLEGEDVRKMLTKKSGQISDEQAADMASNLLLAERRSTWATKDSEEKCLDISVFRRRYGFSYWVSLDFQNCLQTVIERRCQKALLNNRNRGIRVVDISYPNSINIIAEHYQKVEAGSSVTSLEIKTPFHTEILDGDYDYALARLKHGLPLATGTFPMFTMLIYTFFHRSHFQRIAGPDVHFLVEVLEMEKYRPYWKKRTQFIPLHGFLIIMGVQDHMELTIWHHYLMVEFLLRFGCPKFGQKRSNLSAEVLDNNFGQIVQAFLESGQDPNISINVKPNDATEEREGRLTFRFGQEKNLVELPFPIGWRGAYWPSSYPEWKQQGCEEWSLRDWISRMNMENKGQLLRLLAQQSSGSNSATEEDEISTEAPPLPLMRSIPPEYTVVILLGIFTALLASFIVRLWSK